MSKFFDDYGDELTPKKAAQMIARVALNCVSIEDEIETLFSTHPLTAAETTNTIKQYNLLKARMINKYAPNN